jgi:hypothetical protein
MQRQAGTLSKSILEAVMNSVDAEATRCEITLTGSTVVICDDGKGFRSRQEVEDWFEVFGQPHEATENKKYGTFRMGRGQLMAYGRNRWRSGKFLMEVDVKSRGLEYDLTTEPTHHAGCQIEIDLYSPLSRVDMHQTEQDVRRWCRYTTIDVRFNRSRVSVDPQTEKWDYVTDEAYLRLKPSGPLAVYNLGCFVEEHYAGRFGWGGVVVSRQKVMVNFARNSVLSECPVWGKIRRTLTAHAGRDQSRKDAMTASRREWLSRQLRSGEMSWDGNDQLRDQQLFLVASGRALPLRALERAGEKWPAMSVAPEGDPLADKIMRHGLALIFSQVTLRNFGFDEDEAEAFAAYVTSALPPYFRACPGLGLPPLKSMGELKSGFEENYQLLDVKESTSREKVWLRLATAGAKLLHVEGCPGAHRRRMRVGRGPAYGWTDGTTYIAFNRDFLSTLSFTLSGLGEMVCLLLHEMCHSGADMGSHAHDQDFFERYHDASRECGHVLDKLLKFLPEVLESESRKSTHALRKTQDRLDRADRAVKKHETNLQIDSAVSARAEQVRKIRSALSSTADVNAGSG